MRFSTQYLRIEINTTAPILLNLCELVHPFLAAFIPSVYPNRLKRWPVCLDLVCVHDRRDNANSIRLPVQFQSTSLHVSQTQTNSHKAPGSQQAPPSHDARRPRPTQPRPEDD